MRVLYFGAGNPMRPTSGMDAVLSIHLKELRDDPHLDVSALITSSKEAGCVKDEEIELADPDEVDRTLPGLLRTACRMIAGYPIQYRDFWSSQGRRRAMALLEKDYDAVIIDHFIASINLPILMMICRPSIRRRLLFIGHNVTFKSMFDAARLAPGIKAKIVFGIQAIQSAILEWIIVRLSNKVILLSADDAAVYGRVCKRSYETLFPAPLSAAGIGDPDRDLVRAKSLVFIGSPNFSPNQEAIRWLRDKLGPELLKADPDIRLILIGKGTDQVGGLGSNISAKGFVTNQEMMAQLEGAAAFISPVVHGSGIKIKILDALVAGRPIVATSHSLSGYGFMGITPKLFIDDPARSASEIVNLLGNRDALEQEAKSIRERWSSYQEGRKGLLSRIISTS